MPYVDQPFWLDVWSLSRFKEVADVHAMPMQVLVKSKCA